MGLLARIQDQLCTPEQGNRFPAGLVRHLGIPYLGRSSAVDFCPNTGNAPLTVVPKKLLFSSMVVVMSGKYSIGDFDHSLFSISIVFGSSHSFGSVMLCFIALARKLL
jgi:hypothetical protein